MTISMRMMTTNKNSMPSRNTSLSKTKRIQITSPGVTKCFVHRDSFSGSLESVKVHNYIELENPNFLNTYIVDCISDNISDKLGTIGPWQIPGLAALLRQLKLPYVPPHLSFPIPSHPPKINFEPAR